MLYMCVVDNNYAATIYCMHNLDYNIIMHV